MIDPQSHVCPLCSSTNCYRAFDSSSNLLVYDCKEYGRKLAVDGYIEDRIDELLHNKIANLLFEHCIQHSKPAFDSYWKYHFEPDIQLPEDDPYAVNLFNLHYPQSFGEKTDRSLLNLVHLYPGYDETIPALKNLHRAFFSETDQDSYHVGLRQIMVEIGYLRILPSGDYAITAKGWERIDELTKRESLSYQCFVAIAFREETEKIREAIRKAAGQAGYRVMIIDEKEHNNQIVPEILYEIERSRFLIMDTTIPNYGAYYEAGYAMGLGKQVIACCRKEEFDQKEKRPHFDIQQKSLIIWEDENELTYRLRRRIEATIGHGLSGYSSGS